MKIFPAIDIKDKKCVRLVKGDFDNKTEYEMSPVEQAGKYKDHGFKNLHIVDLDGALTGEMVNLDIRMMMICVAHGGDEGNTINKDRFKDSDMPGELDLPHLELLKQILSQNPQ